MVWGETCLGDSFSWNYTLTKGTVHFFNGWPYVDGPIVFVGLKKRGIWLVINWMSQSYLAGQQRILLYSADQQAYRDHLYSTGQESGEATFIWLGNKKKGPIVFGWPTKCGGHFNLVTSLLIY